MCSFEVSLLEHSNESELSSLDTEAAVADVEYSVPQSPCSRAAT